MNSVRAIITPIDYACNLRPAVMQYNTNADKTIQPLDIKVLAVLYHAMLGTQALRLRKQAADGRTIFSATFNAAINRLLDRKLITRTKRSKYVYYNITMKGRTALEQINEHLINIVDEQIKARG